jgi:HTH-type transcriptional regulator, competence development regulator
MTTFGELLREKRRLSGLSQRQLAEGAGVDFSYISKLENGRLPAPADDTVVRICEILGCPADEFFTAAKKLPTELGESLVGEPAALRFLQEASRLKLSQEEWEKLLGNLQGLRGGDDERRKK